MPTETKKSFFTTLPGIITAITGLIVAITGMIKVLNETNNSNTETPTVITESVTSHEGNGGETSEEITTNIRNNEPDEEEVTNDLEEIGSNSIFNSTEPVWKQLDGYFYIYLNKEQIAGRTTFLYVKKDLLVFDPISQTYFLLANYDNRNDNQLRKAEILETKSAALWRQENGYFYIYQNGKEVNYSTMPFDDIAGAEDRIVFDEKSSITYLLPNYHAFNDNKLRAAKIIRSAANAFWVKNEKDEFWFYKNGTGIHHDMKTWFDNNHLIAEDLESGSTYKLKDFKIEQTYKIHPAIFQN